MPTAPDGAVFIRWEAIELTPDVGTAYMHIHVKVTVNVGGILVASFIDDDYPLSSSFGTVLVDLLDNKRSEYVTP